MPKGTDSLCPLGFHPQFRRPNYCKRCFREYSEHKSAKDSSSTSINSLSYERSSKSEKEKKDDTYGSRDSLILSRSRSDLARTGSEEEDRGGYPKRPMSWSAQDLRKAVNDAKENVKYTKEDVARYYGSTRSLTQDLGTLSHLLHDNDSTSDLTKEKEPEKASSPTSPPKTSSFSSYLAMRTKSPARPPLSKSSSLQSNSSRLEDIKDAPETQEKEVSKPSQGYGSSSSSLRLPADSRPPKSPSKLKPEKMSSITEPLEVTPELSRSEKSKKIIESLREVKSEDADASYVIRIKPKKSASATPKKVEIDLQPEIDRLQQENKEMVQRIKELESKNEQVEAENKELLTKKPRFGDLKKQTDITKLQSKLDECNEEVKKKTKELKDVKKELEKRPLPKNVEKTMEDLRSKLKAAEQLCEELMDENEDYKKEIRTMEEEIEEMQDNFREEQADEYRDLKRELEQRAKDCRVLQFKLKKAERRSDTLERDKDEFEEKLHELQVGDDDIGRAERVKAMERELSLAKEVSMKMHEEMEKMKTQLDSAEKDKRKLSEKVQDRPLKPGAKVSRSQVIGRQGSQDNIDQVYRDLQDSLEREQDIKEQLRFAEEETTKLRKKLSRVEEENETLQLQLNKMSSKAKQTRQRSMERSGSMERSSSVERGSLSRQGSTEKPLPPPVVNGEELDPTEMKIQLELNEQESTILRRKVEDLESENIRLQKEFKELLSSSESKKTDIGTIPETTKDNVYFTKKIKMLEQESGDLRRKVIDYEREKDALKSEIETVKKRAKVVRSRSLEQAEADEKRTQEVLANETDILKKKFQELEEKYEQTLDENKRLTVKSQKRLPLTMQENMYIEKQVLEDKVKRMEKRLKDAQEKLKKATSSANGKEGDSGKVAELQAKIDELQLECNRLSKENEELKGTTAYAERTPKKPKELTPKSTLVKWVNELEAECATLHAAVKEAEKKRASRSTSEDATGVRDLEDKLQKEKERNEELNRQLKEERGKGDSKLGVRDRNGVSPSRKDTRLYETQIEDLKQDLEEERGKYVQLRAQIREGSFVGFDELRKAQTEKHRLQKELASSQQSLNVLERKWKESEETLKISEKAERNLRSLLEKAEARLEEERNSQSTFEGRQKDMTMSWLKERDDLKREVTQAKRSRDAFEKEVTLAERAKQSLENQLQVERKRYEESDGKQKNDKEEVRRLRKEKEDYQVELDEAKDSVTRLEREKERAITRQEKEMSQLRKDKEDLSIRMTTLETELKTERKKKERLERDSSVGLRGKATELEDLKEKLTKAEQEKAKHAIEHENWREEYESKIKGMEKRLSREKREADKLQGKIDLLENEILLLKTQVTESSLRVRRDDDSLQKEYDTLEMELKRLRETYVLHQDTWIKEKLDLQLQLKEYQDRSRGSGDNGLFSEKLRLKNIIDDKNQQYEVLKVETDTLKDQLTYYRRESEDLRKKLDDLEKLQELTEKHQSSSVGDLKEYQTTIKDLRSRLTTLEKTHKSESTKTKMRNDTKVKALTEEVTAVTQHMSKYRRERDTYKEMLDGAQRTIADLKGSASSSYRTSRADNVTEIAAAAKRQVDHQAKAHLTEILDLQSLVTELEDKLADSRLDSTKMKNELVDQKSNFEIQLGDMQTKLNEYEEDRLLGGGGRRVPGLRTRLELNWQKEREEQQRLIQETATLAKDLRQTLYEVERERDMERLEAKRKIEQLKRTVNQDHHDTKSKVQELQRDLQELREAHAKLRQINEKLRREKDRTEVEREAMRDKFLGSSRDNLNQQSKMERLLDELKKIKELSPLVLGESIDGKDASLNQLPSDPKPKTKEEFTEALRKLNKTSEEIRIMMSLGDDRDRFRRTPSFRRALSTESDDEGSSVRSHSAGRRGSHRPVPRGQKSQLYRKSQSLDHQLAEDRGKIWVSTDVGSTSSIESNMTDEPRAKYDLDKSLDRISTGSQTSDLDQSGEHKKKGLKNVFSKFGKSKSIEDTNTAGTIMGVGLKALAPGMTGSGNSISSETEKETSVKGRLKTLFKKGPPSRSQSVERDSPSVTTKRRDGLSVKKISSTFETDTSSVASNTSLDSSSSAPLPPVLRRLQGRAGSGVMAKAQSFSALGRKPSTETNV